MSKPGRPPYEPTQEAIDHVEKYALMSTQLVLAEELNIDVQTFRKYFGEQWRSIRRQTHKMIVDSIFEKALGDGPHAWNAAKFIANTQMSLGNTWLETQKAIEDHKLKNDLIRMEKQAELRQKGNPDINYEIPDIYDIELAPGEKPKLQ